MYMSKYRKHNNAFFLLCYSLCLVMTLMLILSFISPTDKFILAADTYWSNNKSTSVESVSSVYQIRSGKDLAFFFHSTSAKKAVLYCDIDMSAHVWDGPESVSINKELDGKGNTITGLRYKGTNNGLVAKSTAGTFTFKNMSVYIDATTSANGSTGAFVGEKTGGSLTISSCSVYGSISNSGSYSSRNVGGMVGKTNELTATSCFNYAAISGSATSYSLGGIVGNASSSTLTLCSNSAAISGTATYIGGLVGYSGGLTMSNSRSCNSGAITNNSTSSYTGGIVGYAIPTNTTISYVYNTGVITSSSTGGGLVGASSKTITFGNVYNSAKVSVLNKAGGWEIVVNDGEVARLKGGVPYQQYNNAPIINNDSGPTYTEEDYWYTVKATLKIYETKLVDVSFIGDGSYNKSGSKLYSINPHNSSTTADLKFVLNGKYVSNGTTIKTFGGSEFYLNNYSSKYVYSEKINIETGINSYWYAQNYYPFRYAIFGYEIYDLPNQHYSYYKDLVSADLVGITIYRSGNNFTMYPTLDISYTIIDGGYHGGNGYDTITTDVCGTYSYTYTASSTQNINYISEDSIKSASFEGSYFSTNSQINGGLPYFPEMYW